MVEQARLRGGFFAQLAALCVLCLGFDSRGRFSPPFWFLRHFFFCAFPVCCPAAGRVWQRFGAGLVLFRGGRTQLRCCVGFVADAGAVWMFVRDAVFHPVRIESLGAAGGGGRGADLQAGRRRRSFFMAPWQQEHFLGGASWVFFGLALCWSSCVSVTSRAMPEWKAMRWRVFLAAGWQ